MAVETAVFLATEAQLRGVRVETTHPSEYFPTVPGKSCTDFELARLEARLDGQEPSTPRDERLETFSLMHKGEHCGVSQIPDPLVQMRAHLTFSRVGDAAQIGANTEELRPRDGQPVALVPIRAYLQRLTPLAMQAQQEGQHLDLCLPTLALTPSTKPVREPGYARKISAFAFLLDGEKAAQTLQCSLEKFCERNTHPFSGLNVPHKLIPSNAKKSFKRDTYHLF